MLTFNEGYLTRKNCQNNAHKNHYQISDFRLAKCAIHVFHQHEILEFQLKQSQN